MIWFITAKCRCCKQDRSRVGDGFRHRRLQRVPRAEVGGVLHPFRHSRDGVVGRSGLCGRPHQESGRILELGPEVGDHVVVEAPIVPGVGLTVPLGVENARALRERASGRGQTAGLAEIRRRDRC